ncbi:MAG: hypothetical protein WCH57_08805 [Verrucomicrobiota bacterium]
MKKLNKMARLAFAGMFLASLVAVHAADISPTADNPEVPAQPHATPAAGPQPNAAVAQALAAAEKSKRDQAAHMRRDPQWQPAYAEVAVLDINRLYPADGPAAQKMIQGARVLVRSFCVAPDGRVLIGCAPTGQEGGDRDVPGSEGRILVLNPQGERLAAWPVPMTPQALALAADGTLYVAGAGRLCALDPQGRVGRQAQTPNFSPTAIPTDPRPLPPAIAEAYRRLQVAKNECDKLQEELNRLSEANDEEGWQALLDKSHASFSRFEQALPHLQQVVEAEPHAPPMLAEACRQLQVAKNECDKLPEKFAGLSPQKNKKEWAALMDIYRAAHQRKNEAELHFLQVFDPVAWAKQAQEKNPSRLAVQSLAVTDRDLFLTCLGDVGMTSEVWRFDRQFGHPQRVLTGLNGCCGCMDIQARVDGLWVAHNERHRVERYDRDGWELAEFGREDHVKADGFGGCCEPKNLRLLANGDLLAAESGPPTCVKRFSAEGRFLGVEVVAPWDDGCVEVVVDYDAREDRIYLLHARDQTIHVFARPASGAQQTPHGGTQP